MRLTVNTVIALVDDGFGLEGKVLIAKYVDATIDLVIAQEAKVRDCPGYAPKLPPTSTVSVVGTDTLDRLEGTRLVHLAFNQLKLWIAQIEDMTRQAEERPSDSKATTPHGFVSVKKSVGDI
jgi:hypothetical protein